MSAIDSGDAQKISDIIVDDLQDLLNGIFDEQLRREVSAKIESALEANRMAQTPAP